MKVAKVEIKGKCDEVAGEELVRLISEFESAGLKIKTELQDNQQSIRRKTIKQLISKF